MPQDWERTYIVACRMKLGREAEAKDELRVLLAVFPQTTIRRVLEVENYQTEAARQHLAEPLRAAGLPD